MLQKKVLLIGGTGTISTSVTRRLVELNFEVYLLNRGKRLDRIPEGVNLITADIYDVANVTQLIADISWDCVIDFIAFDVDHIKRDYDIFHGKTKQYIFISTASAYQKPPTNHIITESTPLINPYWEYSRNKIACEEWLMQKYREEGYPITIVRPSHTYNENSVPIAIHGGNGAWSTIQRMLTGKPVIIPGDGSTLWTMTFSDDFAKGFVGLVGNPHALGQAVHITTDECLTWNQIYAIIAGKLGVTLNPCYVPTDALAYYGEQYGYDYTGSLKGDKSNNMVLDNSKIKSLVPNFVATIRYDQGVAISLQKLFDEPALQKEDPKFDEFCDLMVEKYGLLP